MIKECKFCKKIFPNTKKYFNGTGKFDKNNNEYLRKPCKKCHWEHKKNLPSGRNTNRKKLNAWKLKAKCKCGYSKARDKNNFSIRSLTFHHKKNNKVANISDMMNFSWDNIIKEIKKCDVICFNCHMSIHGRD